MRIQVAVLLYPTPELTIDAEAIMANVLSGRLLYPDVAKRVHERAKALRDDDLREYGPRKIAVAFMREVRDEA